jgi:hypothetical protein
MAPIGNTELNTSLGIRLSEDEINYSRALGKKIKNPQSIDQETLDELKILADKSAKNRELRQSANRKIEKNVRHITTQIEWMLEAGEEQRALKYIKTNIEGLPEDLRTIYNKRSPILGGVTRSEIVTYLSSSCDVLHSIFDQLLFKDRHDELRGILKGRYELPEDVEERLSLAVFAAVGWPEDETNFQDIPREEKDEILRVFDNVLKSKCSPISLSKALKKAKQIRDNISEEKSNQLNTLLNPYLLKQKNEARNQFMPKLRKVFNDKKKAGTATIHLVCGIVLAFAFRDDNSYSYYTFLRWIVCASFIFFSYKKFITSKENAGWLLGGFAVLYNPILGMSKGVMSLPLWSIL